jgi:hypothetical protein
MMTRVLPQLLLLAGMMAVVSAGSAGESLSFNRDVRPILSDRCFACHGPDSAKREADLRLDRRESAVASAIIPGDPESSELIRRVRSTDPELMMPPADSHKLRLTDPQLEVLERWIEEGAPYEPHWSFIRPSRSAVPDVAGIDARDSIDAYISARQKERGIGFHREADAATLARRISFDLIGLPPEPFEVDRFQVDSRPDRLERWTDELLASPAFGERLASYWFDLIRFADTVGYHGDQEHAIWPFRDYVLEALNANMPFDQFTREQLAGDLLPKTSIDQRIATAYNRVLQTSHEGGVQPKEYLLKYASDRVRNLSAVWLGLTMGCAECHDHKFDELTQRDFYQLAAFFADVQEKGDFKGAGDITPTRRDPEIEVLRRIDRDTIAEKNKQLDALRSRQIVLLSDFASNDWSKLSRKRGEISDLRRQMENVRDEINRVSKNKTRVMVTVSTKARPVRILSRGDWMDESGPIVKPAIPAAFGSIENSPGSGGTRLDLANWLTSPANPLTSRMLVNRLWSLFHGTGLAKNLEDIGSQGDSPTHPELLDALSLDLIESGWDMKGIVRRLVNSTTYRQSSLPTPEAMKIDPNNELWTRQGRSRRPAEMIRDAALATAGLLVREIGGRSVRPYQPAGYFAHLNFPQREYVEDTGPSLFRRSVYTHWQRQYLHPMLKAFDAPSREECTAQRQPSNTPAASLVLLNDPEFVEAARFFGLRAMREGPAGDAERLRWMARQAFGRIMAEDELSVLVEYVARHRASFGEDVDSAQKLVRIGRAPSPVDVDAVEWATWTAAARVLFNLDEMITRY